MDVNFEQKVREKAYEIWMSAGMADGMAHEHWVTAEQAVTNETVMPKKAKSMAKSMESSKTVTAAAKKPAAKPAAKAAKKPAAKAPKAAKPVKH